jgi:putative ABC transport system permease protein
MQSTNEGALVPGASGDAAQTFKKVKMAPKIAYRNLFHDRLSLFVTLIGIVFSVLLVAIQCGLYIGSERTIAAVIDQVTADLWVVPIGTKSFDDASLLTGREKYAVLSTPGVQSVDELVVGFGAWRKPEGGKKAFILVGSDWKNGGLKPWNIVQGSLADLDTPNSVAVDKSYFPDLGITELGQSAEINNAKVKVTAVTKGIRSFTTLPYIFTSINRARTLVGAAPEQASYQLVRLDAKANIDEVQKSLAARLPDTEVLKHAEFRDRSLKYWLFKTGAGGALIAGAGLGIIVGVVIVAQTLYSSTKDHLNEFATLRALGASASYIHAVILIQAILSALIGYAVGITLSMLAILATKATTLNVVMTPKLALFLLALTIGMCIIAAISAIFKVTRIDPAGVFSR